MCFDNGLLAQVIYGKGETLWQSERKLEVQGEKGEIILNGDTGMLILGEETKLIEVLWNIILLHYCCCIAP